MRDGVANCTAPSPLRGRKPVRAGWPSRCTSPRVFGKTQSFAKEILAEEVELVYRQALPGFVATLVNAVVLAAVLRGEVSGGLLVGWLAVMAILTTARALGVLAFRRNRSRFTTARWRTLFVAGAFSVGMCWGGLALIFPASVSHQMVIGFALAGMAAGATPFLAPVPVAYVAYTAPALVPFIVRLYSVGSPLHVAMSAMTVVFLGVMVITARRTGQTVHESLALRHEHRELEGRHGLLFRYSPVAILEWDSAMNLRAANPTARAMLSLGDGLLLPEPTATALRALASRGLDSGSIVRVAAEVDLANGSRLACESHHAAIVPDGSVAALGVISVLVDTREREALVRAKSAFVAAVSHELRTPLTTIRGTLGLLEAGVGGQLDEEGRALVGLGLADSARLAKLVEQILEFESTSNTSTEFETPVEVVPLVERAVSGLRAAAQLRKVDVKVVTDANGRAARTCCGRLGSVLDHLVDNAIAFAPPGTEVRISVTREQGSITIVVIDEGEGVPVGQEQAIFAPFAQADGSTTRRKGGTGLGLSISRALVERAGGRLTHARGGDGITEFRVILPEFAA